MVQAGSLLNAIPTDQIRTLVLIHLADAVSFVHHEESDLDPLQGADEPLVVESLRRNIQQSDASGTDLRYGNNIREA